MISCVCTSFDQLHVNSCVCISCALSLIAQPIGTVTGIHVYVVGMFTSWGTHYLQYICVLITSPIGIDTIQNIICCVYKRSVTGHGLAEVQKGMNLVGV